MESVVDKEGQITLKNRRLKCEIDDPYKGQVYRVMCNSVELFVEKLVSD